jgi:hypothetical protein
MICLLINQFVGFSVTCIEKCVVVYCCCWSHEIHWIVDTCWLFAMCAVVLKWARCWHIFKLCGYPCLFCFSWHFSFFVTYTLEYLVMLVPWLPVWLIFISFSVCLAVCLSVCVCMFVYVSFYVKFSVTRDIASILPAICDICVVYV